MIADAAELQLNAERKLREMLVEARGAGQLKPGQPPKKNAPDPGAFSRVRLREAGISHNLSASAQQLAAIPERRFAAMVAETRAKSWPRNFPHHVNPALAVDSQPLSTVST